MKSPITSIYGILAIVAFVLVLIALHLLGAPDGISSMAAGGVSTLILGLGNIHGADQATVQALESKLSQQVTDIMPVVQSTIGNVKEDLLAKHAANAQQIAVHDAIIAAAPALAPPPAPKALPVVEDKPHLVT